jgi:hypothetical protein
MTTVQTRLPHSSFFTTVTHVPSISSTENGVSIAKLISQRLPQLHQRNYTCGETKPSELKFGRDFDHHELVSLTEL